MKIFVWLFETIVLTLVLIFMLVLLGVIKLLIFIDKYLFCTCHAVESVYGLMDKLASIYGIEE